MNRAKVALPLLVILSTIPHNVTAAALLGPDMQSQTVFSKTYTTTGANSKVYGNVFAGDVSTTGANANVYGDLVSVGAATTGGANSTVSGRILSGGVLTTGAGSRIGAGVTSSGAATIGANSVVFGDMVSGGVATTGAYSDVIGNVLAAGAASTGANSVVFGGVSAVGAISIGAGSFVSSQSALAASPVDQTALTASLVATSTKIAGEVVFAQTALSNMGPGKLLAPTMTVDTTLLSGVYSAASLSTTAGTTLTLDGQGLNDQFWVFNITDILATGASTNIVMINAGQNDSVIWNTGGYASLGASSNFLGTILADTYISVGAHANVTGVGGSCGGVFSATSYVSTGDTATIGGAGCSGIGSGFNQDSGVAIHSTTPLVPATPQNPPSGAVPEPATWVMMIIGVGLVGGALRRRRAVTLA